MFRAWMEAYLEHGARGVDILEQSDEVRGAQAALLRAACEERVREIAAEVYQLKDAKSLPLLGQVRSARSQLLSLMESYSALAMVIDQAPPTDAAGLEALTDLTRRVRRTDILYNSPAFSGTKLFHWVGHELHRGVDRLAGAAGRLLGQDEIYTGSRERSEPPDTLRRACSAYALRSLGAGLPENAMVPLPNYSELQGLLPPHWQSSGMVYQAAFQEAAHQAPEDIQAFMPGAPLRLRQAQWQEMRSGHEAVVQVFGEGEAGQTAWLEQIRDWLAESLPAREADVGRLIERLRSDPPLTATELQLLASREHVWLPAPVAAEVMERWKDGPEHWGGLLRQGLNREFSDRMLYVIPEAVQPFRVGERGVSPEEIGASVAKLDNLWSGTHVLLGLRELWAGGPEPLQRVGHALGERLGQAEDYQVPGRFDGKAPLLRESVDSVLPFVLTPVAVGVGALLGAPVALIAAAALQYPLARQLAGAVTEVQHLKESDESLLHEVTRENLGRRAALDAGIRQGGLDESGRDGPTPLL